MAASTRSVRQSQQHVVRCAFAVLLFAAAFATCQTGTEIPACPTGSQSHIGKDLEGHRVFIRCDYPGRVQNGMKQCAEWEGSYWNSSVTVPCGSRASIAIEQTAYERQLGCPAARQVYRWNSSTKTLDTRKTCLPDCWEIVPLAENGCPSGSEPAGLDDQDICVGRRKNPPVNSHSGGYGTPGKSMESSRQRQQPEANETPAATPIDFATLYAKLHSSGLPLRMRYRLRGSINSKLTFLWNDSGSAFILCEPKFDDSKQLEEVIREVVKYGRPHLSCMVVVSMGYGRLQVHRAEDCFVSN